MLTLDLPKLFYGSVQKSYHSNFAFWGPPPPYLTQLSLSGEPLPPSKLSLFITLVALCFDTFYAFYCIFSIIFT